MIIARGLAKDLIRTGVAGGEMLLKPGQWTGKTYVAITRYDLQRVDHYEPSAKDLERLGAWGMVEK